LDVVADDLDGAHEWDSQDQSHRAPQPSPEKQRDGDRQRVQLQALAQDLGIEHVHGDQVQPQDNCDHDEERGRGQVPQVGDERRDDGENNTEVRNQAQKSADDPEEVEIRQAQHSEHNNAAHTQEDANDEVAHDERPDHARNQTQHDVSGIPVFHAEQHHRGGAHVVLPAQHEENQERYKGDGQHHLRYRAGIAADQVGPVARLADGYSLLVRFRGRQHRLGGVLNLLGFGGDPPRHLLDPGLVLRQRLHEIHGAAIREIGGCAPGDHQQQHGDQRRQGIRYLKPGEQVNQRRQHKCDQDRDQNDNQDYLGNIKQGQDGGDRQDKQRRCLEAQNEQALVLGARGAVNRHLRNRGGG